MEIAYIIAGMGFGAFFILVIVLILVLRSRYRRVPPGWAMVVNGFGTKDSKGNPAIVTRGGRIILPFIQTYDLVPLGTRTFDVFQWRIPTVSPFGELLLNIKATVKVRVPDDIDMLRKAVKPLAGRPNYHMNVLGQEIVLKYLVKVCSTTDVHTFYDSRALVAGMVKDEASKELSDLGIELISVEIREVEDNLGYLARIEKKRTFRSQEAKTDHEKVAGPGSGLNERPPKNEAQNRMRALALHEYALHLLEKGEIERALEFFKKACSLDPDEPMYRKDIDGCRALIESGKG